MILFCTCKHDYQDKKYGTQMRVHNKTLKGKTGPAVYRCTVCEKEKTEKGDK